MRDCKYGLNIECLTKLNSMGCRYSVANVGERLNFPLPYDV